jgi:four helix bundle protein
VIDAAEDFAVDVARSYGPRARFRTYSGQACRAAGSVHGNLIEGYGRGPGPDRMRLYRYARASCEETLGWLRDARSLGELGNRGFYRLTNRGVAIIRMINSLRY